MKIVTDVVKLYRLPSMYLTEGSWYYLGEFYDFFFFLIVCFTSYFVFSIAVLPHSPGVVYYHLLLRRETRIPGVLFSNRNLGSFCA